MSRSTMPNAAFGFGFAIVFHLLLGLPPPAHGLANPKSSPPLAPLHSTTTVSSEGSSPCLAGDSSDLRGRDDPTRLYTTAVIKIAYDGTFFRGWTAGNSEVEDNEKIIASNSKPQRQQRGTPRMKQSRRSRTLQRKGGSLGHGKNGRIRTVSATIQSTLAKVYGDVNPKQITIESCSRTDKGVHATSLVAQFYCLRDPNGDNDSEEHGTTRPDSPDDCKFRPLPFNSDLSKLVFVLNRMLPPDVRIVAASPLPRLLHDSSTAAFHPSLSTVGKTYTYQIAVGPFQDPLKFQYVWHLDGSSKRAVGMNGNKFCLDRALLAADLFVDADEPRDYGAFRASFRGSERGRVQSTMCRLWCCEILQEKEESPPSWGSDENVPPLGLGRKTQTFTVVIKGDRFLYKMVRNIVGSIVAVACGHLELEDLRVALDTGEWGYNDHDGELNGKGLRTIRRICAPARGLKLTDVHYPREVDFDWRTG